LYEKLRDMRCRTAAGCPSDRQAFQIIDNAQEVNFGDQNAVNQLCSFVPNWSSVFSPMCGTSIISFSHLNYPCFPFHQLALLARLTMSFQRQSLAFQMHNVQLNYSLKTHALLQIGTYNTWVP